MAIQSNPVALQGWATCERIGPFTVELQRSAERRVGSAGRPMARRGTVFAATLALGLAIHALSATATAGSDSPRPEHGIAMHGQPLLPAGFDHFAYANPDAPKGGRLVQGVLGS